MFSLSNSSNCSRFADRLEEPLRNEMLQQIQRDWSWREEGFAILRCFGIFCQQISAPTGHSGMPGMV